MKRYFGALLLLVLCLSKLYAYDFCVTNSNGQTLYYNINTDGTSVTVTHPGSATAPWEGYNVPTGRLSIPSQIIYNGSAYTVTVIGSHAFSNCSSLSSVVVPSSIITIEDSTFTNTSIDTLFFEANLCASRLKKDIFGNIAFLYVGGHVQQIPTQAFMGNNRLQKVVIDSVLTIGTRAFKNCSNLQSITLPTTINSIGSDVFTNCSSLDDVQFLGTLTDWFNIQFSDSLSNPTSQSHQISLSGTPLTQITIPTEISTINNYTFYGCSSIRYIAIPIHVTNIATDAFINTNPDTLLFGATGADDLLSKRTFGNVKNLFVGENVTTIGTSSFANDTTLTTVSIESVQKIGMYAFRNCTNLDTLSLSSSIDSIHNAAFANCSNITTLNEQRATPPYLASDAFNNTPDNKIVNIPCGSLSAYQTSWTGGGILVEPRPHTLVVTTSDSTKGYTLSTQPRCDNPTATIEAHPNSGYRFLSWNDGDTTNPRNIIVTQDTTFVALFAPNSHTITATSSNNTQGTVDGNGIYPYLDTATLTAIPTEHYHFMHWNDGATNNPRTIVVTNDTVFTAFFAIDSHYVAANSNDETYGTISGSGQYPYEDTIFLLAQATPHHHFAHWQDGDTTNPRQIVVTQNLVFQAIFQTDSHNVVLQPSNDSHGTVLGEGTYPYGATATIAAIPSEHYHFLQWQDGETYNPRQITILSDTLFVASFVTDSHSVVANSNDETMGNVSGGGVFPYGDTVLLFAQATPHHHFAYWQDGDTTNPRQIVVTQDIVLEGIFVTDSHNIALQSNNPHYGTVWGDGTYPYGATTTITAIPSEHYHFLQWQDGETHNPRQITITSDTLFVAIFAIDSHWVSLAIDDAIHGTVAGEGCYPYGTQVQITATAFEGYTFTSWSNGITNNPYQLLLTSDTLLVAQFATLESITDTYGDNIIICVVGRNIYVTGADGADLQLFDLSGRQLLRSKATSGRPYSVPQKGIYFIKIDRRTIKVIVP